MRDCLLLTAAVLLTSQAPAKLTEGVYSMCEEVAGYSGEVVELKDGKFRYWFTSDVSTGREPEYPLSGEYRVSGDTLTLVHDQIHRKDRTIAVVNGVDVLWRDDGLKLWKKEQRIHPYAILIRMPGKKDGSKVDARPSLEILYTQAMKDRENKEYEERFNDQPAEVRALLRADTLRSDPDRAAYRAALAKARETLEVNLVSQLIARMGRDTTAHVQASTILRDLYAEGDKARTLPLLIDGLSAARDRYGVEDPLLLFLRITGVGEIDLTVPKAGVRIRLKTGPNGGYTSASEALDFRSDLPKTTRWTDELKEIVPAVQKWMRDRLAK